ncbi:methyltransferase, TIGR04325 family [Leptospira yanagawae]|uniref:Methyltransferase, TIGR04325 family n=1 Tax=Leptospira yanagawae TaxID=293069 RepID=A0ABY2LZW7_9LEPT|nr:methyltransferase, TIGR04325 family [Leptospira yanagawae]TGL16502.1 methyltransferase, TIGR04325 family [Leptospira yanagawae]
MISKIIRKILTFFNHKSIYWFRGNFDTWEMALASSSGYDSEQILDKVVEATREVVSGKAVFERDSVLFYKKDYSPVFLSMLYYVISRVENNLFVMDFGGSLGSVYFQNRELLSRLKRLEWSIIEQGLFVTSGKKLFENETLKFYYDLNEFSKEREANLVIFSSSLPYIKDWQEILKSVVDTNVKFILIDRTPFFEKESVKTRICVEYVPKEIYEGSYPVYIFNQNQFESILRANYNKVFEFNGIDSLQLKDEKIVFKGLLFERK